MSDLTIPLPESANQPPPLPPVEPTPQAKPFSIEELQAEQAPAEKRMSADEAWQNCDAHSFQGDELKPFTASRQGLMQLMGATIFTRGEEVSDQFAQFQSYNGIVDDAHLAVWVCKLNAGQIAKHRMNPGKASQEFTAWEDRERLNIGSAKHSECLGVWSQILQELFASSSEPEDNGSNDPSATPGES